MEIENKMTVYGTQWEDLAGVANTAISLHGKQQYSCLPYSYHLSQVVGVLYEWGYTDDPYILSAGWLHDVLEDTDTSEEWLRDHFYSKTVDIVVGCTGVGKTRKEKQDVILNNMMCCENITLVKCADRLANIRHCVYSKDERRFKMYQKEHESYYLVGNMPRNKHLISMVNEMAKLLFMR